MTKNIFESVELGNIQLKNRLVRSATDEGMCTTDGQVTNKLIDLYRELSAGEVGLIITGLMEVVAGNELGNSMRIDCDKYMEKLQSLVEVVHENGAKVVAQLAHRGPQMHNQGKSSLLSPSGIEGENCKEANVKEIKGVIKAFGDGALRAKKAGFDGVQIHAAHGYFLSRFLTPLYNKRVDIYGGNIENRARILREVVREVRKKCGADYPLFVKINGSDYLVKEGLEIEESKEVMKHLVDEGINAIEISGGSFDSIQPPARSFIREKKDEAYHLKFAKQISEQFDISIITVGGCRSIEVIEKILDTTKIEAVALCRPFICEPNLAKRWCDGDRAKSKCVSCNKCATPQGVRCILKA